MSEVRTPVVECASWNVLSDLCCVSEDDGVCDGECVWCDMAKYKELSRRTVLLLDWVGFADLSGVALSIAGMIVWSD